MSHDSNGDRLLEHLRREVPELGDAIAELERRWGIARPTSVCTAASVLALAAYDAGDEQLGLRIVAGLLPGVAKGSATYAPNCVHIAFLEHEGWHEPAVQEYVDRWPAPMRDILRRQQADRREHEAAMARHHQQLTELHRTAHGQPVAVIAERLRALEHHGQDDPGSELGRELTARVLSNRRWLTRHPVDSVWLAWRYRTVRRPWRTIAWLRRPRFAG